MSTSDHIEDAHQLLSDHEDQRRARSRSWIVALLLLVVVALAATWWQRAAAGPQWSTVTTWHPGITLASIEQVREWGQPGQPLAIPAGKPYRLEPGHWLILSGIAESDEVRVSIDAEWLERIDAIELAVRADSEPVPSWWMAPRSVNCQFGGYSGVESSLSVNREPGPQMRQVICPASMRIGQRYVFALESTQGVSRMLQDGWEVLQLPELTPLNGVSTDRIAIRSWAPIQIHGIRVERLRTGVHVPVLRVGDALMAQGEREAALRWYKRVADEHAGTSLAALALAKVAACAAIGSDPHSDLQMALERITANHADDPLRERVESIVILSRWRQRDFVGALTLMEEVQRRNPTTRLPLNLIAERTGTIPAPHGSRLAAILLRMPNLRQLDLSNLGLKDIAMLSGCQLTDLNLSGNPVSDLSPLMGMPLERLRLSSTAISDLSPLKGLPLRILAVADTKVGDLSPLAGMRLEEFDCSQTAVTDLSPLRGQPLRLLIAHMNRIESLSPIASCPVQDIRISDNPITDLSPLNGKELTYVDINSCPVTSIEAIAGPKLANLDGSRTRITDLAPLQRCERLRQLSIADTAVQDISALAGLPLENVILDGSMVSDLGPLQGAPITNLMLRGVPVTSLAPLTGMPLKRLEIVGTRVASLMPIAQSPIQVLDIGNAPATDLFSLSALSSLQYLGLDAKGRTDLDSLADQFSELGRFHLTRLVRAAMERQRAPEKLRSLAVDINGRPRLAVGCFATWDEARALAAAAGARLVAPRDRADLRAVLAAGGFRHCEIWSDLRHVEGMTILPDGTPAPELPPAGATAPGAAIHLYWSDGGQGCAWSSSAPLRPAKLLMLEWPR